MYIERNVRAVITTQHDNYMYLIRKRIFHMRRDGPITISLRDVNLTHYGNINPSAISAGLYHNMPLQRPSNRRSFFTLQRVLYKMKKQDGTITAFVKGTVTVWRCTREDE
ncbi:hypothetical protein PG988_003833 [Apiospora saccharicola]